MSPLLQRALRAARGPAAIYLGASILARVGSFILIPLYVRRLSLEEYGDYALAQTLVSVLPTLITLGLVSSIARYYFGKEDRATAHANTAAVVAWLVILAFAGAALLEAIVLVAFPDRGDGLFVRWELSCVVVAALGAAISAVPTVYLRLEQRAIAAAAFQLGQFVAVLVFGVLFVAVLGRGLRGAIEATAVAQALNGAASLAFILTALRGRPTRALLVDAVRFSLPFVPHLLANWAQGASDRWTMKGVHLDKELGGYSLAVQVTTPASMVVTAWNDQEAPRMGQLFKDEGLLALHRATWRFARGYLIAAALPSAATIVALPLAALIVGKTFAASLSLVPWLLAATLVDAFYYPTQAVVYYARRTRVIPVITVGAAVLNTGLNVALVPVMGVMGAVAARFAGTAARSGFMWLAARRVARDGELEAVEAAGTS